MRISTEVRLHLVAASLAGAAALAAAPASAGSLALPLTTNVTVTNSSLPVSGSVSISNGTLNVHSVDNRAVNSFAENSVPTCVASGASYQLGTPGPGSGETLVLETVSVQFSLPVGTFPQGGVRIAADSAAGAYTLAIPAELQGSDGSSNYYVASQALKAYSAGNGVSVSVNIGKNAGYNGTPTVCISNFGISGYLLANP